MTLNISIFLTSLSLSLHVWLSFPQICYILSFGTDPRKLTSLGAFPFNKTDMRAGSRQRNALADSWSEVLFDDSLILT